MTRTNARYRSAVARQTRRNARREGTRQLYRGQYDAMASGERMIRRTPSSQQREGE